MDTDNRLHLLLSASGTALELRERMAAAGLPTDASATVAFLDDVVSNEHVVGGLRDIARFVASGCRVYATFGSTTAMRLRSDILACVPESQLASYQDGAAVVYDTARLSAGVLLFPQSLVSTNTSIGTAALLYHGALVAHDSHIGARTIVSNRAVISGHCTVGDDVYVGANATVLERVTIGEQSIVAAGATVVEDVPPGSIYIGPGRVKPNHYWDCCARLSTSR